MCPTVGPVHQMNGIQIGLFSQLDNGNTNNFHFKEIGRFVWLLKRSSNSGTRRFKLCFVSGNSKEKIENLSKRFDNPMEDAFVCNSAAIQHDSCFATPLASGKLPHNGYQIRKFNLLNCDSITLRFDSFLDPMIPSIGADIKCAYQTTKLSDRTY